jgi:dephospho-CoA kinase
MSARQSIIAFVGMPGSGKSKAAAYLQQKGMQCMRFGDLTDEKVREAGLELTPENEKTVREKLRKEYGMAVYAERAIPKMQKLLDEHTVVAIDGLYSWEEYLLLKKQFINLFVIHVYAEPKIRYQRLATRTIRGISPEEARVRDIAEIENMNKGGPIAIADFLIENNSEDSQHFYKQIEKVMERLSL